MSFAFVSVFSSNEANLEPKKQKAESPQMVEEWIDVVKKATMMGGRIASRIETMDSAGSVAGHGLGGAGGGSGIAGGHTDQKLEVLNLNLKVADTSQKSLAEVSNRVVDYLVDAMDALETEENEERAILMKKRGMTLAPMLVTDDDADEDTKSVNPQVSSVSPSS